MKKRVKIKKKRVIMKKKKMPTPPPETSQIGLFALAIRQFEGWYVGSRSYENNNPGNLRWTTYTQGLGATSPDKDNFCIFADYSTGLNALHQFLTDAANNELKPYKNCTIKSFFEIYAPSSDSNNPDAYAKFVANFIKVAIDTPIKNLL